MKSTTVRCWFKRFKIRNGDCAGVKIYLLGNSFRLKSKRKKRYGSVSENDEQKHQEIGCSSLILSMWTRQRAVVFCIKRYLFFITRLPHLYKKKKKIVASLFYSFGQKRHARVNPLAWKLFIYKGSKGIVVFHLVNLLFLSQFSFHRKLEKKRFQGQFYARYSWYEVKKIVEICFFN